MKLSGRVSDYMSRDVTLASPDMSIFEAALQMRDGDFGILPIGDSEQIIGMVTDRDIVVRALAEGRDPKSTTVREVMSENVASCFEDQGIEEVSQMMGEKQIRRLPVMNREQKLVGILAIGDFARDEAGSFTGRIIGEISQPTPATLHSLNS